MVNVTDLLLALAMAAGASACERASAKPEFEHPEQRETGILRRVECARSRGQIACRGDNWRGILGRGTAGAREEAWSTIGTPPMATALAVSPSESFACAVLGDGAVWCWGLNLASVLGARVPRFDGLNEDLAVARPGRVDGLPPIVELRLEFDHACAVAATGRVYCWGSNGQAEVADPRIEPRIEVAQPREVPLPGRARALTLVLTQSCALLENNDLYCWGGSVPSDRGPQPAYEPTHVGSSIVALSSPEDGKLCARTAASEQCWPTLDESVRDLFAEPHVARVRVE